jgi:hypothetical protein
MNNDQLYALYLDAYARSRSPMDTRTAPMSDDFSAAARLAIALGVRDAQDRIAIMKLGAFLKLQQKLMATDTNAQEPSLVLSVRAKLHKLGIVDPPTPLLRAALLHEHMKTARDLAHSNLHMLNINVVEVSRFDEAEALSLRAYSELLYTGAVIVNTDAELKQT